MKEGAVLSNLRRTICGVRALLVVFWGTICLPAFGDWPTHRGNDQRTGFREQSLSAKHWRPAWVSVELDAPAPAWPAPARGSLWQRLTSIEPRVTDDRGDVPIIAADSDGRLHVIIGSSASDRLVSLDPVSGRVRWQYVADAPIRYAPCAQGGVVWFGADDGIVRSLDLRDGTLRWSTQVGPQLPRIVGNGRLIGSHPIRTSVMVVGEKVFVNAGLFPSQGVYTAALESADGTLIWRRRTERSPQGYLLTDNADRLYVPCGRAAPYCVSQESGRFISDLPSAGGTFGMVTESAFFSGPGNDANVQSWLDVPKAKMLPLEGRTVAAGAGRLWVASGSQLLCHDLQKKTARENSSQLWASDCQLDDSMIVSGQGDDLFVFTGGRGQIQIFDALTGNAVHELTLPDTNDEVRYLAVAAGAGEQAPDILVATTAAGNIFTWHGVANKPTDNWAEIDRRTANSVAIKAAVKSRVQDVLDELPVDVGMALVLNDLDGSHTQQLIQKSRLNVISIVPTVADRDRLRSIFLAESSYGRRITVLNASPESGIPVADRLFNVVLEAAESDYPFSELRRVVDSAGGLISRAGKPFESAPPLNGGGVWRHQYGAPDNSSDSDDDSFAHAAGFRLQWFGGVGPSRMPDRHLRGQAPLAAGPAMILHGDECLIGVDPANGVERWQVELPRDSMRYVMPFDAGHSCLTADGRRLFTATAEEIWQLNALTGERLGTVPMPNEAQGLYWGYLAESDGMLFASAMKPTAGRLKGEPLGGKGEQSKEFDRGALREMYTKQDYDSTRPLVCSRFLFGMSSDGRMNWNRASDGVIPNSSISLHRDSAHLVFIEGKSEACRSHSTDRVSVSEIVRNARVTCLDAATGQQLWEQPLDWQDAKNVLYTQLVGDYVVVASSESRSKKAWYRVGVLRLSDGEWVWTQRHAHIKEGLGHGEQVHHPLALRQPSGRVCILAEPYLYNVETGERIVPEGAPANWALRRPGHSCGTLSGAGQCVFFRATNPTVFNFAAEPDDQIQKLSPSRPGCWINMLPANGRLLIPEGSASCVCAFPLQTSMGFVPVTGESARVPFLEDFPRLEEERVQQIHAWDFSPMRLREKSFLPTTGTESLAASAPVQLTEDGLLLDGQQWLSMTPQDPVLPEMPATLSLEAYLTVARGTPEWSGIVGAIQDNGNYERGCLLGIHNSQFFFAIASEHRTSLTYLRAPTPLEFDRKYHVVGTYDGRNMRLYLDGKLIAISPAQRGAVLFDQKSWFSAGIYKDNNDHFPLRGTLSRVSMFRGALSADQVRERFAVLNATP